MNRSESSPGNAFSGQQPMTSAAAGWAVLLSALWGGTPVAIKYSVSTLEPMAVAGLRFAMAAVFMLIWCRWEQTDLRLRRGQGWPAVVMAGMLFLQIATFTIGIDWSNASHGTLFVNTFVFWVAAISHFVLQSERLTRRRLAGLFLAGFGVVLLLTMTGEQSASVSEVNQPSVAGDLLLLASALILACKLIYTKQAIRHIEPSKLIFWHDVIGVGFFATASLAFEETSAGDFTLPAVMGLTYQGVVVAGFCFAMQARLLKRHSASKLAVFSFSTPLFGLLLAVLMRGEQLSPWLGVSAVCVAVGIYLEVAPKPSTG